MKKTLLEGFESTILSQLRKEKRFSSPNDKYVVDVSGVDEDGTLINPVFSCKKEELSVSTMLSFEAYVDDFAVDYSFSAIVACKNSLDVTIKPGRKAQGEMGFEVKKGWKTIEIEYETAWLFGETLTFKYTKGASNVNTSSGGMGTVYVQAGTNARTQPDSSSGIAAFIENGGNYAYYSLTSGWYYIKLSDDTFGYVFSSRCTVVN